MRAIMQQGFEIGVHCYDHVKWQDGVANATLDWTRHQMRLAVETFESVFGQAPRVHGAAGWQLNAHVPQLEEEFGFRIASDTRGSHAFQPAQGGVPQLPTTLPTLDELIGRDGATAQAAVDALLSLTAGERRCDHVFTLHAELEGSAYLAEFERLLSGWRAQDYRFVTLGGAADALDLTALPRRAIESGCIAGRTGELALQSRE